MKNTGIKKSVLVITFIVISNFSLEAQAQKPIPPTFLFRYEPEKVLRNIHWV